MHIMKVMNKLNKTQKLAMVLGYITTVLKKYSSQNLSNLMDNSVEFLSEIKNSVYKYSKSLKEIVSLQCLKDYAKTWSWSQEQQDKIGQKLTTVFSAKDIWSAPDTELLDTDTSKFGEACITSEKPRFNFEDTDEYKVLTEKELFPNIDFTKESNILQATRRFIQEIDKLNQESIKTTGKAKYYIPGLDYMDFVHKNQDKILNYMKDGNLYYYSASSFRNLNGKLRVPCSDRDGSSFYRRGVYVGYDWRSSNRFLVLEII